MVKTHQHSLNQPNAIAQSLESHAQFAGSPRVILE